MAVLFEQSSIPAEQLHEVSSPVPAGESTQDLARLRRRHMRGFRKSQLYKVTATIAVLMMLLLIARCAFLAGRPGSGHSRRLADSMVGNKHNFYVACQESKRHDTP